MPTRTRSTLAILAAGTGLSIVVTVLADILLTRLRSARQKPVRPSTSANRRDGESAYTADAGARTRAVGRRCRRCQMSTDAR